MIRLIFKAIQRLAENQQIKPVRHHGNTSTVQFVKMPPVTDWGSEAANAQNSGDLAWMINALDSDSPLNDKHFLFMTIVNQTYKKRQEPEMRKICREIGFRHVNLFSKIKPIISRDIGFVSSVSTFKQLAILLTEDGEFEEAIKLSRRAIRFGVHDGTDSGFEGRIQRIIKKAEKAGVQIPAKYKNPTEPKT
ncbi:hypothetical protein [Acanthopleuribacter pedis]|uniref:Uncharacterized protein n=1 Tax=Acanthopleuribacter pedis TaxID=442870 RepID=A0A8J7U7V9_9BACT|nr:hypothetical protein [Acanthopleuribacter pedis]MBO1323414.1 hypothetical protein [Acanthopleuribacter pedis]